jgi:hypothetical protein
MWLNLFDTTVNFDAHLRVSLSRKTIAVLDVSSAYFTPGRKTRAMAM